MLRSAIVVLTLSVVACVPPQPAVVRPSGTADDAYTCVLRELNIANYTIVSAEREAGLIRAELRTTDAVSAAFAGGYGFRVLTVSVYQQDGGPMLRITPAREFEDRRGRRSGETNGGDNEAAAALAAKCGSPMWQ